VRKCVKRYALATLLWLPEYLQDPPEPRPAGLPYSHGLAWADKALSDTHPKPPGGEAP
jgi:hypothetical protein